LVHLGANISSAAPKAVQEELHARVRAIFEAPDLETARTLLAKVVAEYERVAPTAIAILERGFDDATAVLALPTTNRKRLRTGNGQERLNEEVR
jgi:transposase-like protein